MLELNIQGTTQTTDLVIWKQVLTHNGTVDTISYIFIWCQETAVRMQRLSVQPARQKLASQNDVFKPRNYAGSNTESFSLERGRIRHSNGIGWLADCISIGRMQF